MAGFSFPKFICASVGIIALTQSCGVTRVEGATVPRSPTPWQPLFDGVSLAGWQSTSFGGEGEVYVDQGSLILPFGSPLTGINLLGDPPARQNYELQVVASRESGTDFFCGLTFPVGESYATVVLGGWGGGLCGLSCIDQLDASMNASQSYQNFTASQAYTLRVQVRPDQIRAWLNEELLFEVPLDPKLNGQELSLRPEMLPARPLGVASYTTEARISSIRWRPI
jgi:3-keto-disaccharide hydrolase